MATVKGVSPPQFGLTNDIASLITQKATSTQKVEKKEARNKTGDVIAKALYNTTTEISVEGLGDVALALVATVTTTGLDTAGGAVFLEELTRDYGNEDFVKSSIKGMAYAGIAS